MPHLFAPSRGKPIAGSTTIDWSHRLASQLCFAALFNEVGATGIQDIASNTKGAFAGTLKPSWLGDRLTFPGGPATNGYLSFGTGTNLARIGDSGTKCTFACRVYITLGSHGVIACRNNGANNGPGWTLYTHSIGGGQQLYFTKAFATTDLTVSVPIHWDQWVTAVVVFDGSTTAANQRIYTDGALQGHLTDQNGSGASSSDISNTFYVGSWAPAGGSIIQNFDGALDWLYIWRRALNAAEVQGLSINPYSVVRSRSFQLMRRPVSAPLVSPSTSNRQFAAPAGADAVSVTPNATGWANSSYVTVLAATDAACVLTGIAYTTTYGDATTVDVDFEIDVATGPAASEVVIATFRGVNAKTSTANVNGNIPWHQVPIAIDNIANGARLSVRMRKAGTSTTAWLVSVMYFKKPIAGLLPTTTKPMLALPAAADGITATGDPSAFVSGAWVQMRAATGNALVILGLAAKPSGTAQVDIDIGTGGAGAEVVITSVRCYFETGALFPSVLMLPTPLDNVAASTRVAVRLRTTPGSTSLRLSLMVMEKPL